MSENQSAVVGGTMWFRWAEVLFLLLLLASAFAARWPFRQAVLIRDEGEYAYVGQQILHGAVPYRDVYNQKTPFVFYLLAAIQQLGGPSLEVLRLTTAIYGAITTLVVYRLARRLLGPLAAVGAALAFSVMTFDQCGIIHSASTEFFMLLWIALAVDLWYRGRSSARPGPFVLAGVAAGLAYQTKQTGLAVLVFFILERCWARWRHPGADRWRFATRDVAFTGLGFAGVLGVVVAFFAAQGALGPYVECTWTNNWQYVGQRFEDPYSVAVLAGAVLTTVSRWDVHLWLWGTAGLIVLARQLPAAAGGTLWLLLLLLVVAALGTGAPFVHYYEPLIVPLALGNGVVADWLGRRLIRPGQQLGIRAALVAGLALPYAWPALHWVNLMQMPAVEREQLNRAFPPFGLAPRVAQYVAERTTPDECFLVIGSEPELYYYAERCACTRLVFTFPLTGPYTYAPRLQQELQRDWQEHHPRYVILVNTALSERDYPVQRFLAPLLAILEADYVQETKFADEGGVVLQIFRRVVAR
jgi:4-amino-4-deoxy-L-arabinose transferase-like glycosyltransferase